MLGYIYFFLIQIKIMHCIIFQRIKSSSGTLSLFSRNMVLMHLKNWNYNLGVRCLLSGTQLLFNLLVLSKIISFTYSFFFSFFLTKLYSYKVSNIFLPLEFKRAVYLISICKRSAMFHWKLSFSTIFEKFGYVALECVLTVFLQTFFLIRLLNYTSSAWKSFHKNRKSTFDSNIHHCDIQTS